MCASCALQVQSVIHPLCQVCFFTFKIQILNVLERKKKCGFVMAVICFQGGNMQVAVNGDKVKPWWQLKARAGWRLVAVVFCFVVIFSKKGLFVKSPWTLWLCLWLHLLHTYVCTQRCLLTLLTHELLGGWLTFSNVVLCMVLVTFICSKSCGVLVNICK